MPPEQTANVERELFIRSFFSVNPPPRVTNQFVAAMEEVRFEEGEVIYRSGESPDNIYFIIDGAVRLEAPGQAPWELQEHSIVGIIDAALKRPHARTAIASRPVDGIVMAMQDYLDILNDNFDFTQTAILFGAARIHELSLDLAPHHVFPKLSEQQLLNFDLVHRAQPMDEIERLIVLHNARAFTDAPIQPLVSLARLAVEERWSPGEVIFEPGQPAPQLRFVAHGRVVVKREHPEVVGEFGPGGLLTGIGALAHPKHLYSATAKNETVTLRISKEDLFDAMEDHSELTRACFSFVARENERVRGGLVAAGKDPDGRHNRKSTADLGASLALPSASP